MRYVYQIDQWPNFTWDAQRLIPRLGEVRHIQGLLTGKMKALGFNLRNEAYLETLSQDVIKSSEIEGEMLDSEQVRSSIAVKLGMETSGLINIDRNVDGVVEMMLDATQNYSAHLTTDRLFGWHSSLFPGGRSGMYQIIVGDWRDDSTGPMQVVSGAMGKERVHFQAPDARFIHQEVQRYLTWFNRPNNNDPVINAAIAHLWLVTIHPFEDGNGRITRAVTDMVLTQAEHSEQRFYSMSAQIRKERKEYYRILEASQKGSLDITEWIEWFLNCLHEAISSSDNIVQRVLYKHNFWNEHSSKPFNPRQIKIINKLFDGFVGKLTTSKWAKINKCSSDTALRDIQDLMKKEVLKKEQAGGRSTHYQLV